VRARPILVRVLVRNDPPAGHAKTATTALALPSPASPARGHAGAGPKRGAPGAPGAPAPPQTKRMRRDTSAAAAGARAAAVVAPSEAIGGGGGGGGGDVGMTPQTLVTQLARGGVGMAAGGSGDDSCNGEQMPAPQSRQVLTYTPAALRVVNQQQAGIRKRRNTWGLLRWGLADFARHVRQRRFHLVS